MAPALLISVLGAALVVPGLTVPAGSFVAWLRPAPPDLLDQLATGARLFKIGLIGLGLFLIVLSRLPIWTARTRAATESAPSARSKPRGRLALAALVILLVVGSGLRLYGLDGGLWYDEILTNVRYARIPFGEIVSTYDSQNQHILYSVLAHASFRLFGESAWSLRLPAALFGIGSIWALYLVGRQLASRREAVLAAGFLTFSYHHVWFSQNARGYSALLFWTLLSSWLIVRALREGRPRLWVLYAAAAALGTYTHTTMLFVILAHFLIYATAVLHRPTEIAPGRWTGLFLGFGLSGLLIFQLYALVLPQTFGGTLWQGARNTVTTWKNPVWTVFELLQAVDISFPARVVAIVIVLVFGAGFLAFCRHNLMVVQLFVLPPMIGAVVILALGHPLFPRSFFPAIGFATLILAGGSMEFGRLATRLLRLPAAYGPRVGTTLAATLIFLSAASVPLAYAPKQDYLAALRFIESMQRPGDIVTTVGVTTLVYTSFYQVDWQAVETLEDLNAVRARAARTWLLYTLPVHLQSDYADILASIQRDFQAVKTFYGTLGGGTIFVCRSDSPPAGAAANSESPRRRVY